MRGAVAGASLSIAEPVLHHGRLPPWTAFGCCQLPLHLTGAKVGDFSGGLFVCLPTPEVGR